MKNKTMRKAMITSIIALVVCFAMLVGTTYAWFTDSVASSGNIIKSGTLNIDLLIKTGTDNDYVSVKQNPAKKAFNYELWEPGYTEWVNAKVVTTGNLALKYTMRIIANGAVSALADVIDVYYAPSQVDKPATRALTGLTRIGTLADALAGTIVINDTLIPGTNTEDFATLALHMQETAGNEYQNLSIGTDFSLQILATQYTHEADSFDDQYDALAQYPVIDAAAATAALAAGQNVVLGGDIAVSGPQTIDGAVLDGNGKTITVSNTGADCGLHAKSGEIKNVTVVGSGRGIGTGSTPDNKMNGDLYIDNVTVNGPTYAINIGDGQGHKLIVTDSTLRGWTSMSNIDASFTDCTFGTNGQYQYFAFWNGTYEFDGCTFVDGFQFFSRDGKTGTIALNNCTWNGTPVTAANFVQCFDNVHDSDFGYLAAGFTVTVDGTPVAFN